MDIHAPIPAFYFEIASPMLGSASFQECSGLSQEIEVEEYAEGGMNSYVHRLPGRLKAGNIELKRGLTKDRAMATWFEAIGLSTVAVMSEIVVSLLSGQTGEAVASWVVTGAYPVRWNGPSLDAQSSALAFETVELAFRHIKRVL